MIQLQKLLEVKGRPINGAAFDLEGTIIDLEPLHFAAHVRAAESLGLSIDPSDMKMITDEVPHFIGGPHEAIMEELVSLAEARGTIVIPEGKRETLLAELSEFDHESYRNLRDEQAVLPPRDGFLPFLEQVQSREIPVAIGSLTDDSDAWLLLERSGLDKLFDPDKIVLRSDVTRVKPDPEVYLKTASRMGIGPAVQAVFEDSHNGIRAAREAGSIPVGMPVVLEPAVIERLESEGAVIIFEDWKLAAGGLLLAKEAA